MPKTFTDDVAAAFPSSIVGPLLITDPEDHDSWIKIDPESARIEGAGTARPTRKIIAAYSRAYSSVTASFIGVVMPANYVTAVTTGGFHTVPFPIPSDMDLTQPVHAKVLITPLSDDTGSGEVVRLSLATTYFKAGEAANESTVTYDWTAPTNWSANDPRLVLIDDGNGRTFAGNTFEAGDYVGLRISRVGAAAEDTFDKSVRFADFVIFEYAAKNW